MAASLLGLKHLLHGPFARDELIPQLRRRRLECHLESLFQIVQCLEDAFCLYPANLFQAGDGSLGLVGRCGGVVQDYRVAEADRVILPLVSRQLIGKFGIAGLLFVSTLEMKVRVLARRCSMKSRIISTS